MLLVLGREGGREGAASVHREMQLCTGALVKLQSSFPSSLSPGAAPLPSET